jgi:hypothetical protein
MHLDPNKLNIKIIRKRKTTSMLYMGQIRFMACPFDYIPSKTLDHVSIYPKIKKKSTSKLYMGQIRFMACPYD